MVKPAFVTKRTHNAMLDLLAEWDLAETLPSENELARRFDVSRTTMRGVLKGLAERGALARRPNATDYFDKAETIGPRETVERVFMQRILSGDFRPGQDVSETELARASACSVASVREFLVGFTRYRLVERRRRGGWRMLGFHAGFAAEVADMRWMIENAAMDRLQQRPDRAWSQQVTALLHQHRALQADIHARYLEFPALDRAFHLWIAGHLRNRFADDFYDVVSLVFHYHYQWNRIDERERNIVAMGEHLGVLEALSDSALEVARDRLRAHLTTSRTSLLRSLDQRSW